MTASGGWPSWATEPVEILDHDPNWRQLGEHISTRLDGVLARWLTQPSEHVRSTAIPELAAKPIIDIQASVTDFRCAVDVADALRADGWHAVPAELDQRPWRRFYVLPEGGRRTAHLHLLINGSTRRHEQLPSGTPYEPTAPYAMSTPVSSETLPLRI